MLSSRAHLTNSALCGQVVVLAAREGRVSIAGTQHSFLLVDAKRPKLSNIWELEMSSAKADPTSAYRVLIGLESIPKIHEKGNIP